MPDSFILSILKNYLFRSKEELEMVKRRVSFYSTFIKKGDLCFDVGANIGNRVEPLLKLKAKVVAIDHGELSCHSPLR